MVTVMQVEELSRALITLNIHLTATTYWVLTEEEFSWNTTCVSILLLKLAFALVWSFLSGIVTLFPCISGPPSDAQLLRIQHIYKVSLLYSLPGFWEHIPSLRTSEPVLAPGERWPLYGPTLALTGSGWGARLDNLYQHRPTMECF